MFSQFRWRRAAVTLGITMGLMLAIPGVASAGGTSPRGSEWTREPNDYNLDFWLSCATGDIASAEGINVSASQQQGAEVCASVDMRGDGNLSALIWLAPDGDGGASTRQVGAGDLAEIRNEDGRFSYTSECAEFECGGGTRSVTYGDAGKITYESYYSSPDGWCRATITYEPLREPTLLSMSSDQSGYSDDECGPL